MMQPLAIGLDLDGWCYNLTWGSAGYCLTDFSFISRSFDHCFLFISLQNCSREYDILALFIWFFSKTFTWKNLGDISNISGAQINGLCHAAAEVRCWGRVRHHIGSVRVPCCGSSPSQKLILGEIEVRGRSPSHHWVGRTQLNDFSS